MSSSPDSPPGRALSGDAHRGAGSYRRSHNQAQRRPGSSLTRPGTWRLTEEMTVKRIRIDRPRVRRDRPWREVLPPDPRDPDVVRAKALARAGNPRQKVASK